MGKRLTRKNLRITVKFIKIDLGFHKLFGDKYPSGFYLVDLLQIILLFSYLLLSLFILSSCFNSDLMKLASQYTASFKNKGFFILGFLTVKNLQNAIFFFFFPDNPAITTHNENTIEPYSFNELAGFCRS